MTIKPSPRLKKAIKEGKTYEQAKKEISGLSEKTYEKWKTREKVEARPAARAVPVREEPKEELKAEEVIEEKPPEGYVYRTTPEGKYKIVRKVGTAKEERQLFLKGTIKTAKEREERRKKYEEQQVRISKGKMVAVKTPEGRFVVAPEQAELLKTSALVSPGVVTKLGLISPEEAIGKPKELYTVTPEVARAVVEGSIGITPRADIEEIGKPIYEELSFPKKILAHFVTFATQREYWGAISEPIGGTPVTIAKRIMGKGKTPTQVVHKFVGRETALEIGKLPFEKRFVRGVQLGATGPLVEVELAGLGGAALGHIVGKGGLAAQAVTSKAGKVALATVAGYGLTKRGMGIKAAYEAGEPEKAKGLILTTAASFAAFIGAYKTGFQRVVRPEEVTIARVIPTKKEGIAAVREFGYVRAAGKVTPITAKYIVKTVPKGKVTYGFGIGEARIGKIPATVLGKTITVPRKPFDITFGLGKTITKKFIVSGAGKYISKEIRPGVRLLVGKVVSEKGIRGTVKSLIFGLKPKEAITYKPYLTAAFETVPTPMPFITPAAGITAFAFESPLAKIYIPKEEIIEKPTEHVRLVLPKTEVLRLEKEKVALKTLITPRQKEMEKQMQKSLIKTELRIPIKEKAVAPTLTQLVLPKERRAKKFIQLQPLGQLQPLAQKQSFKQLLKQTPRQITRIKTRPFLPPGGFGYLRARGGYKPPRAKLGLERKFRFRRGRRARVLPTPDLWAMARGFRKYGRVGLPRGPEVGRMFRRQMSEMGVFMQFPTAPELKEYFKRRKKRRR